MQSIINIKDQPCGSGKTTSMIEGFQQDRKYLVIVPELTEVDRVIEGSKSVPFQQPHANDNDAGTKTQSLENLVLNGINIVATHKLHENLVPLAKDGLFDDYDIIIDEVPNIVNTWLKNHPLRLKNFTSTLVICLSTKARVWLHPHENGGLTKITSKTPSKERFSVTPLVGAFTCWKASFSFGLCQGSY